MELLEMSECFFFYSKFQNDTEEDFCQLEANNNCSNSDSFVPKTKKINSSEALSSSQGCVEMNQKDDFDKSNQNHIENKKLIKNNLSISNFQNNEKKNHNIFFDDNNLNIQEDEKTAKNDLYLQDSKRENQTCLNNNNILTELLEDEKKNKNNNPISSSQEDDLNYIISQNISNFYIDEKFTKMLNSKESPQIFDKYINNDNNILNNKEDQPQTNVNNFSLNFKQDAPSNQNNDKEKIISKIKDNQNNEIVFLIKINEDQIKNTK